MQVYDAKNAKRYDKLAEKRRKVFVLKTLFFAGLFIAMVGFAFYILFFSGLLDIKDVSISGLNKTDKEKFHEMLNSKIDSRWMKYVESQKNTLFFKTTAFKAEISARFPEIKEISVGKKLPHSLNISIVERETAGVWCFTESGLTRSTNSGQATLTTNCRYFDKEGVIWGEATESLGFLILNVKDMRRLDKQAIDSGLLATIMFVSDRLKEMDILVSRFIVPEDFFGDFKAQTSRGYELLLSIDSNIKEQLEALQIFLAEKQKEPEFKPQYIDLRINGRVYYK